MSQVKKTEYVCDCCSKTVTFPEDATYCGGHPAAGWWHATHSNTGPLPLPDTKLDFCSAACCAKMAGLTPAEPGETVDPLVWKGRDDIPAEGEEDYEIRIVVVWLDPENPDDICADATNLMTLRDQYFEPGLAWLDLSSAPPAKLAQMNRETDPTPATIGPPTEEVEHESLTEYPDSKVLRALETCINQADKPTEGASIRHDPALARELEMIRDAYWGLLRRPRPLADPDFDEMNPFDE